MPPPSTFGPVLRKELFEPTHSVIMTSATLAVGRQGSFEFFKSRVGLTQADTIRLGSPFNYRQQVKLILLDDMPDPTQQREQFDARCVALIRRYVARTDGRAFVLFTSYDMMRRAASQLTAWLAEQNLALYSQADGLPRHEMLEQFKGNPRSVLFGADSFWQGVDVPGDALQNVIITKLPVQRSGPAAVAGAAGSHPPPRRQSVHGLPGPGSGDQAEAGLRPPDPHPAGPRHRRAAGPAGADQALRPDPAGIAAVVRDGRGIGVRHAGERRVSGTA